MPSVYTFSAGGFLTTTSISDSCPPWAQTLIANLRDLEIQLGTIPENLSWTTRDISEVATRIFKSEENAIHLEETMSEQLFRKIASDLSEADFTPDEIARFINARVGYKGGPPYCSAAEVLEAILTVK